VAEGRGQDFLPIPPASPAFPRGTFPVAQGIEEEEGVEGQVQGRCSVHIGGGVAPGEGDDGDQSLQGRRSGGGDGPLDIAQVTGAPHAQRPVEPWLAGQPVHGGPAVGGLMGQGFKVPLRVEASPGVLDEDVVSAFGEAGEQDGHPLGEEASGGSPAVGGADQDGGVGAGRPGEVMVGPEGDAVGHGDGQVAFDGHFISGGGQAEQPGQGLPPGREEAAGGQAQPQKGESILISCLDQSNQQVFGHSRSPLPPWMVVF